jgi:hypothetical protein
LTPNSSGKRSPRPHPDRLIAELAGRHGVIDRRALVSIGLTDSQIEYRLEIGRLHLIHRGVYAVGTPTLTTRGRWLAAVLAVGPDAVISHRTAATLSRLLPERGPIHLTAPRRVRPRRGVRCHRRSLSCDEITVRDGIPLTTLARTLLDIAATEGGEALARALREAEYLRLTDRLSLPALIARYPRHRGTAVASAALEGLRPVAHTRSELEDRFLEFLAANGLPRPEVNATVDAGGRRHEVDCVWRDRRLVAELDGRAAHGTDHAFEEDRKRDMLLQGDRWRVIRITWHRLHRDPTGLADALRRLLAA